MDWKEHAHSALCGACTSFSANDLRQAIVLLDDAASVVAQGHLNERNAAPPKKGNRTAPLPVYLEKMSADAAPQLSRRRLRTLRHLHEVRNVLFHDIATPIEVTHEECLEFLHYVITCAADYGVKAPPLLPANLEVLVPIRVLVEFSAELTPCKFSKEVRKAAVEYCTRRGILAGVIENIGWPLVRCCLCRRYVALDQTDITQEDCMTQDDEPLYPYCRYGCGRAHQAAMVATLGDEATLTFSTEYYLQPLIEKLPGGYDERWRNPDGHTAS